MAPAVFAHEFPSTGGNGDKSVQNLDSRDHHPHPVSWSCCVSLYEIALVAGASNCACFNDAHVIIECKMVKLVFKTNLGCSFSHSKKVWKLHLCFLACCQLHFSTSKRLHRETLLLHISPLSSVMSGGILVLPSFPLSLYLTSGSSWFDLLRFAWCCRKCK